MSGADLSPQELERICSDGRVLQRKLSRPAVVVHADADGHEWVTKLWTRRSRPSSDWIRPYNVRFRANAAELRRRGIAAPDVTRVGRVTGTNVRYATYAYIAGDSLRRIGARDGVITIEPLAEFVAHLHTNGIYFRSLHLGNVLYLDRGGYAIVDVTDVTFRRAPLSANVRARNLSFLLSYPKDSALLAPETAFLEHYRRASALTPRVAAALEQSLTRARARRRR